MSIRTFTFLLGLALTTTLSACASELGEACSYDSQCPSGSICRNNLHLKELCEEDLVTTKGSDGYCTMVCVVDEDCAGINGSEGCRHDPPSDRLLCMPDCS